MNHVSLENIEWQPRIGKTDETIQGIDDIHQCVNTILKTPRGSDPLRPDFGSNLYKLVDMPVNRAVPEIIKETVEALSRWEKRIKIVSVNRTLEVEKLSVTIEWTLKDGFLKQTTEVKL